MVYSNVSDRGGRRCPASRDDAAAQIWRLYCSGKQTKSDPALRPSSRYKSTKNHSKPVAPCPLESSTVHGDALNKAESSCVTKAATLESFLSGQKYWFNHSTNDSRSGRRRCTEHGDDFLWTTFFPTGTGAAKASWISAETLVDLPSKTCTPEMCPPKISPPSPASRHATTISRPDKAKLGFPLEGLAIKTGPSTSSRPKPIICAPIIKETKPRSVKSPLFLLSISNQCLGRLLILKCRRHHLRQNTPALLLAFNHTMRTLGLVSNMAMSFDSKSLKIYDLAFPNQYCRRYEYGQISVTNFPNQKEISASAEEDWKKAQVDSKKILAQPHQSTTPNPSRQGTHPEFNSTSDREVKTMLSSVQNTREPIICADYIVLFLGFDIKEEGSNIRAITMEEPPKELQGLFDDIQWILNLLSSISISFAYVSRKENSIADVLASTAVRSMTIGSLVSTSNGVYAY